MTEERPPYRPPTASLRALSFDGTDLGHTLFLKPDRYGFFQQRFPDGFVIARGAGLSYVPASVHRGGMSIDMCAFDRILNIDAASGVVEVEAGVRIGDLFQPLAARGLYLPVQPGYGFISIGGCIAADVHGKNQLKSGTFGQHILSLKLFHPAHGVVEVSGEHLPQVFEATCGGYGATGIILSARLLAAPLPGARVKSQTSLIPGIAEIIPQMIEASTTSDFSYTWHDFTQRGRRLGTGFLVRDSFVESEQQLERGGKPRRYRRISSEWRARGPNLLGGIGLRALNRLYQATALRRETVVQPVQDALFPIHGSERYFRLYGRAGFHEYQALVPRAAFVSLYREFQRLAARAGICIPLVSAKLFGGQPDLLRFRGEGICVAFNLPRSRYSCALLSEFDAVLRDVKGRPNIIKDSRLTQNMVSACYSGYEELRRRLLQWDPQRLFRSELTARLQI